MKLKLVVLFFLVFCAVNLANASFQGFKINFKGIMPEKQANSRDRLVEKAFSRENLFLNYEEWKTLVEKPDSKQAFQISIKVKVICEALPNTELCRRLLLNMTEKERKDYDAFWEYFSLDIQKYKFEDFEHRELFMKYAFFAIVSLQVELDKTYKRLFRHFNLSEGDKYIIWQHFEHRHKYLKEGKKMPDHLGLDAK